MALVWHCPSCPGTVLVEAGACRECGSLVRLPIARRSTAGGRRRRRLAALAALVAGVATAGSVGVGERSVTGRTSAPVCAEAPPQAGPLLDEFELLQASAGIVGRLAITPDC